MEELIKAAYEKYAKNLEDREANKSFAEEHPGYARLERIAFRAGYFAALERKS